MAGLLVSGPAGAGKSEAARRALAEISGPAVLIEFQEIYALLLGLERGPGGRYPMRLESDAWALVITEYLRQTALRQAVAREIEIVATNSDGDPARRQELIRRMGGPTVVIERVIDPGIDEITRRLIGDRDAEDPAEQLRQAQCRQAIGRWYAPRGERRR